MTATPVLRPATPEDAALIHAMTFAGWVGRVHQSSSVYRETVADVAQQLTEGGGFILMLDGVPAGSARYSPVHGAWEVRRMGVLPEHRGKGYSALLMEALVVRAREQGISELRLAVRHDQPRLIAFYAGMGYEQAPNVAYAHANPQSPPPTVMLRKLR